MEEYSEDSVAQRMSLDEGQVVERESEPGLFKGPQSLGLEIEIQTTALVSRKNFTSFQPSSVSTSTNFSSTSHSRTLITPLNQPRTRKRPRTKQNSSKKNSHKLSTSRASSETQQFEIYSDPPPEEEDPAVAQIVRGVSDLSLVEDPEISGENSLRRDYPSKPRSENSTRQPLSSCPMVLELSNTEVETQTKNTPLKLDSTTSTTLSTCSSSFLLFQQQQHGELDSTTTTEKVSPLTRGEGFDFPMLELELELDRGFQFDEGGLNSF